MPELRITDPVTSDTGDGLRRASTIEFSGSRDSRELFFELPQGHVLPRDNDAAPFALSTLLLAMHTGRTLRVDGSISPLLAANLIELRDVWHCWFPNRYARIDLDLRDITADHVTGEGAVAAFSGGVDAAFTMWRHQRRLAQYRSHEIRTAMMVHGFDIPLTEPDTFASALRRSRDTLSEFDIPVVPVRTNARAVSGVPWEDWFGLGLGAIFHLFRATCRVGLMGSSERYDSLVIPWGSTPLTDPLMSGDGMAIEHDGAGYSRTEKVAAIAAWSKACANLRVCWAGDHLDRNCGECEKCLRTMLNFAVNDLEIPEGFPGGRFEPHSLRRVQINNPAVLAEWEVLLDQAGQTSRDRPWFRELSRTVRRGRRKASLHAAWEAIRTNPSMRGGLVERSYKAMRELATRTPAR